MREAILLRIDAKNAHFHMSARLSVAFEEKLRVYAYDFFKSHC